MSFISNLDEHLALINKIKTDNLIQSKTEAAIELVTKCLHMNKPLLVCGNGGSASDAGHICAELVGRFQKSRRALNVICLSSNISTITAWANDIDFSDVFARQVEAHGCIDGVCLALSTSGSSPNVCNALRKANTLGMSSILLTGNRAGQATELASISIEVPSCNTARVQEIHQIIYHYICEKVEENLSNSN